jgi:hypothetical protein
MPGPSPYACVSKSAPRVAVPPQQDQWKEERADSVGGDWIIPPLDRETADRLRPQVLCTKFQVPMFSEGMSLDEARRKLRARFGLKEGEEF